MTDVRIKKLAQRRCTESDFFFSFFFPPPQSEWRLSWELHSHCDQKKHLSDELLLHKSSKAVIWAFVCSSWLVLLKHSSSTVFLPYARSLMEKPQLLPGEGNMNAPHCSCPWRSNTVCVAVFWGGWIQPAVLFKEFIVPVVWLIACKCAAAVLHVAAIFLHGKELFSSEQVLNNCWNRDVFFCLDCFWHWERKL